MLVCYDEPLPALYAEFADEPPALWAFACLLRPGAGSGDAIAVNCRAESAAPAGVSVIPAGLQVLQFLLSDQGRLSQVQGARCWEWSRGSA